MPSIDFGVQIEPQYGFTYDKIRNIAGEAERLGFESLWVSDHFFMTPESIDTPCLECWTVLSALAGATKKLRLGPMVSSQSYRNPALLAKVAASIDHISGGRLYFGIGAGWKEVEYRAYGYKYPRPAVRIRQLEETIEIAMRMWTEEKATFKGRYHHVEDALCSPKPVQKPHIPIWVGGTGNQILKVAARHADAVNFAWTQPPDLFRERLEALKKYCRKFNRDYSEIRKSAGLMITMAEEEEELRGKVEDQLRRSDTPYMRYLSRQAPNLVGTPEKIAEAINEYASLGVDHFILRFHFGDEVESMRLFVEEVKDKI
jgi:F420-dependent oxidoreductase-like protein